MFSGPSPDGSTTLHSVAIGSIASEANLSMDSSSSLLQARVMENSETRFKNLQLLLAAQSGTQKEFAVKIGTSANVLNQWLRRHRNVGGTTARRVEKRLKLSHGWMDQPRPKEWENMMLASYDERISRSRAVSRRGVTIAARVDSLMDDRAVDLILDMIDILEERQAAASGSALQSQKRPTSE